MLAQSASASNQESRARSEGRAWPGHCTARRMRIASQFATCVVVATGLLVGCGDERPTNISREGLHAPCPSAGCATGQKCIEILGGPNMGKWCEISCSEDDDCPAGLDCALPPFKPDAPAYVCR